MVRNPIAIAERLATQRKGARKWRLVASVLIAGGLGALGLATSTAFAATGTLTATPATGITSGQTITLSGSGYSNSSTGNFLLCNNAVNEPTVALPAPVSSAVSVGCTAPSYSANSLTSTSATGTLSKMYMVASGTIGPPCGGASAVIATCPATDSAMKSPAADAALYPCPPTPAQQAAGDTCSISFGDQANDSSTVTILYQGESAPSATTTTVPAAVTTTPPTTAAKTVTTTAPTATSTPAPASTALAQTGPGPPLWWLLIVGVVLMSMGGLMWLSSARIFGRRTRLLGRTSSD